MDSDPGVKGQSGKCGAEASRPGARAPLDLEAVRERLREKRGPEYWRSLDELAATPEFEDLLHREFPRQASEWPEGVSRRSFLQLAGASLALAGLTACTKQPIEKIVPYVRQPEQVIPGRPLFFATALTHAGYGLGVLAESHLGRPTKIEGNPDHPASLGATDAFRQAAVLCLYDPERSQTLSKNGRTGTWSGFASDVNAALRARQPFGGDGLRILSGTVTSPTLAAQIKEILTRYPKARWHRWEPAGPHQARAAQVRAFGRPVEVRYDFSKADVVVAIDSEALSQGPGSVRYSRDFAAKRRVRANSSDTMSRVYCIESAPTTTATVSDHRLQLPPAEVEAFTAALAQAVGASSTGSELVTDPHVRQWVDAVAEDLKAHRGTSLVAGDEHLSPAAQVLIHAINGALGNAGSTVVYTEPVEADPVDHVASLRELTADMVAGRVDMLLMLGGVNPVYTAPADLDFAKALQKVDLSIHQGLYEDETSRYCRWHIPAAHELEAWGDARAYDGTASIIQPLIEPLFEGKSEHEVMAVFNDRPDSAGHDLVQAYWKTQLPGGSGNAGGFDAAWRAILHDGLVQSTQLPPVNVTSAAGAAASAASEITTAVQQARAQKDRVTLLFRPDPTIYDGRYAANAWLQELPKPLTKLTWDNALVIGPKTAERLGLRVEETVELTVKGRKAKAAVWILPGQAENTAVLTLGYGRGAASRAGFVVNASDRSSEELGFNAYALRTADALWAAPVEIRRIGERYKFACTQNHHALDPQGNETKLASEEAERRHVIRKTTLAELRQDPQVIQKEREKPAPDETMYPNWKYPGHAWGMAIDLNVCTGCSSCVVACQAENNIPVVGKDQVLAGREMHWLRIDRYFAGDLDAPSIHHQPVPCMHCENAPCEVVCPVQATSHSAEGLNDMVYNRCVGTRYCSNNCPYKVRRFNFLRYSDRESPLAAMLYNPDVTVRMRGVMEKCTYCVQRIEQAKIEAKIETEPDAGKIPVGKLQTACQQSCPTQAIVFGDVNDPQWEVSRWKADGLNYGLLEELNTRPRTTYLAKVRNPNPRLEPADASTHDSTGRTAPHGHS
jgi:MoCo/4Fe-4S cofactor protein with predicted Tat translocation signal